MPRKRNSKSYKEDNAMAKSIFEEMVGTYTQVTDYFIPNLQLPENGIRFI